MSIDASYYAQSWQPTDAATTGIYGVPFESENPDFLINSCYALPNADGSVSVSTIGRISGTVIVISAASDVDDDEMPDAYE